MKPNAWRRVLLWGGVVVFILLAIAAAGWTIFGVLAGRRYEGAVRQVRDKGLDRGLRSLAPPPVLEEENAAPIYRQAFAIFTNESYEEVRPLVHGVTETGTGDVEALREWMLEREVGFNALRRARLRPHCRFDLAYEQGIMMPLEEFAPLHHCMKLLAARARLLCLGGSQAEARETLSDLLAICEFLRDEPLIGYQSLRWAGVIDAMNVIDRGVDAATPPTELQAWLDVLPPPGALDGSMRLALRGELACFSSIAPEDVDEVLIGAPRVPGVVRMFMGPLRRNDLARTLELLSRGEEALARPPKEALATLEEIEAEAGRLPRWLYPTTKVMFPWLAALYRRELDASARLEAVRAGLDGELQFASTGAYPTREAGLEPTWRWRHR